MADFDLVVIGAGPGGYVAAIEAAQLGLHTAVVERDAVGGTCLNRGCIPTKTLVHTTEMLEELKRQESCGLHVDNARINIAELFARKDEVVSQLVGGVEGLFKGNGVELFRGTGTITAPDTVRVTGADGSVEELKTKDILIAAGSVPALPPIPGLDGPGVITSNEILGDALDLKSMVVIGGGVIGLEIACVYAALGCDITIVEMLPRILANMDKEFAQTLGMNLKKAGVKIFTSATVTSLEQDGDLTKVNFTYKDEEMSASGERVLAAMGRIPYTEGLFDGVEVEMNRRFIKVDDNFQTSVPHIYAIGDVIGGAMLAHKASAEGIRAVEIIAGKEADVDVKTIPGCVYTSPEIASVGLSEEEAKEAGIETYVGKYSMMGNGKTIISGTGRGFIKVVFNAADDKIIGAQMMCDRATDMIGEMCTAITSGLTQQELAKVMRPHPTYVEAVTEAVHISKGHAVHVMPARKR